MRFASIAGFAALSILSGAAFDSERAVPKRRRSRAVPNDIGPVVDTTPESKRARRRRLARSKRNQAV